MDLIARLLDSPKGIFAISSVTALIAAVAIIGFGAPPVILVLIAWGGSLLLAASKGWIDRKLGRG